MLSTIIHHHKSKTNILIFTLESTLNIQYMYNTGYRHTVQTLIPKGKLRHQVICLLSEISCKLIQLSFRALMKDYTSRTWLWENMLDSPRPAILILGSHISFEKGVKRKNIVDHMCASFEIYQRRKSATFDLD